MNRLNKTTRRGYFKVPIYNVWIDLIVCDSIPEERAKYNDVFRPVDVGSGVTAHFSVSDTGSIAAIFLKRKNLSHDNIAHEVFHATFRVLADKGENISIKHDEPAAYLCGFLTHSIYKILNRIGEKVK